MLAVSVTALVTTGQQQGGRAVRAIAVNSGYAVIQVAPGNPSAVHETAFLNDAHANQRGPRRVRSERDGHLVFIAVDDIQLVGRGQNEEGLLPAVDRAEAVRSRPAASGYG